MSYYGNDYYSDSLYHGKKGWTKKNHKYITREERNGKYYYVYNEPSNNILEKVSGAINNASTTEKQMKEKVEKANELIDALSELGSLKNVDTTEIYDTYSKELDEIVESLKRSERVANDQRHGKSGIFTK